MVQPIVSFDILPFLLLVIWSGSRLVRLVAAAARSNLLINGVSNWFLFHRRSPGQQNRFRTTGGRGAEGGGGGGSGPVDIVAADAADAAGHRRRRRQRRVGGGRCRLRARWRRCRQRRRTSVASADIQKDNKSGYGRIQKDINGYKVMSTNLTCKLAGPTVFALPAVSLSF
jgi:hypothetical protein